jgi:hypothetical protein
MKLSSMKNFSLILLVVSAFSFFGCSENNEPVHYKAGASVKNITPAVGSFIAGDANNRQFTGVHDSLYVKALVVSDAKNSLAFVTFDCIGLMYPELLRIRDEVAKRIPAETFNPDHIVIASTHTHAGPDVVGIWGPDQLTSGVDPAYMNDLVEKAALAIVEAWQNLKPAAASYAVSEFGSDWVYNISDSLSLDRSITAIQFKDINGKSIATITGFACHPTIMDAATTLVSADYVYGLYEHLDKSMGGVNLFLQGAIGGWIQPEYEKKEFEVAAKRGHELGETVVTILQESTPFDTVSVGFKSSTINLPVSNEGFQLLAAAGVVTREITDSVTTEIAWFSIGNAQFATHPGETTPVHSLETKALMKTGGPKIVIGFGMDAVGYILSPEFFQPDKKLDHTDYLLYMSIDREAGPALMKKIKQLAEE